MKKIQDSKKWKVVLVKTIDNSEPVFYRLVNLYDYSIENIPAYRLLDEIINNKKDIINVKCKNNQVVIIDDDGYESTSDIITIDEFDDEIVNIYDWSLSHDDLGSELITRFSSEKNLFSPSNFRIDSLEKIYWECNKGHVIRCGFPVYWSTKCSCPICEMEESEEVPSFSYWAHMTDNLELLEQYNAAEGNTQYSNDIAWKSKKKVNFKKGDEEVSEVLYNITVKGMKPPYRENDKIINLNK